MKLLIEVDQVQRLLDTLRDGFINEEHKAYEIHLEEKSSDSFIKFAQAKAGRMTVTFISEKLQTAVKEIRKEKP